MNTKKTFQIKRRIASGFILVEVIVAISILMLAIPAALTVASKSVFLASYSKDQVIATYLAQEGIEIIRNRRDQNMLRGLTWTDGIWSGDCKKGLRCRVDMGWGISDPIIQNCTGPCSFILDREASGAYAHVHSSGTWTPTKFSRWVQTEDTPCPGGGGGSDEICVKSVVEYPAGGINKTVEFQVILTRWING